MFIGSDIAMTDVAVGLALTSPRIRGGAHCLMCGRARGRSIIRTI
jgi:hypothetical protein